MRQVARPPGVVGRVRFVECGNGAIVERQKLRIVRCGFQAFARKDPEHAHRVVRGCAPDAVVEPPEDRTAFGVPAPPEVDGELFEPADAIGKGR